VSRISRQRDKWHLLQLDAEWDRTAVPIYEAAARGKCVPLLKTLLSSQCKNECAYCTFRAGRKCQRMTWETKKLANVTMHLWRERKICGLFLSSSVSKDPDIVTESQLEVLRTLRGMGYTGYVHLRLMPGVSYHYVKEAIELADRVGVNLEAPNKDVFDELCPNKGGFKEAILKRLTWIVDEVQRSKCEVVGSKFGHGRSGVDTQMIVGAVDDNDWQHLQVTEWLYKRHSLKRVYYSGFEPIAQTPLQKREACPPSREHRLYQSSFLIRDYGFKADSFAPVVDDEGFLPNTDPKLALAKVNSDVFPMDLNSATYFEMVRIPRVGPLTAKRILQARNSFKIKCSSDLEQVIGAKLTRKISPYVDLKDKRLSDF
jgi:predicted DNA-binding helix-hairpin-helix protein